jgi:hypothetical protein
MKTILIIGDSWGVPNYSTNWNCEPEDHTIYKLRNLGYEVLNFSLNGGSMLETIEYARRTITNTLNDEVTFNQLVDNRRNTYDISQGKYKEIPKPNYYGQHIDWLLWFHTETVRDYNCNLSRSFLTCEEVHEISCKFIYRAFCNLLKTIGNHIKTAIIGGQSPVDKLLYQYHSPNFVIEDWRSEIVGRKLPYCYTFSRPNFVDQTYDSLDKKLEILNTHKIIMDSMTDTSLFFDRCHPGKIPHAVLTEKLHKIFSSI